MDAFFLFLPALSLTVDTTSRTSPFDSIDPDLPVRAHSQTPDPAPRNPLALLAFPARFRTLSQENPPQVDDGVKDAGFI